MYNMKYFLDNNLKLQIHISRAVTLHTASGQINCSCKYNEHLHHQLRHSAVQ